MRTTSLFGRSRSRRSLLATAVAACLIVSAAPAQAAQIPGTLKRVATDGDGGDLSITDLSADGSTLVVDYGRLINGQSVPTGTAVLDRASGKVRRVIDAPRTGAQLSGDGNQVAFGRPMPSGDEELVMQDVRSGKITTFGRSGESLQVLGLSDNGAFVLYSVVERTGPNDVPNGYYRLDTRTKQVRKLAVPTGDRRLRLSSDGRLVSYGLESATHNHRTFYDVYSLDVRRGRATQLMSDCANWSVSADNRVTACQHVSGDQETITVTNRATKSERTLAPTPFGWSWQEPSLSDDGKWMAYSGWEHEDVPGDAVARGADIYLMNLTSGQSSKVIAGGYYGGTYGHEINRDGRQVLASSDSDTFTLGTFPPTSDFGFAADIYGFSRR